MNRHGRKGSITLEAALVLPIVIFTFVALLHFAKVSYVKQRIYSDLMASAHAMAVETYVMDKTGLVDSQQRLYQEGASGVSKAQAGVSAVGDLKGMVEDDGDITKWFQDFKDLENATDFRAFGTGAQRLVEEGTQIASKMGQYMSTLVYAYEELAENGALELRRAAVAYSVDGLNGQVAEVMAARHMKAQMTQERLAAMDIQGSLDFRGSHMMMPDDTVTLEVSYQVSLPFAEYIGSTREEIEQSVTVRGWTGSYDTGEVKKPKTASEKRVFYVASRTKKDNPTGYKYHQYSCLRKPLQVSDYATEVSIGKRALCDYCRDHFYDENISDDTPVYFTSENSKIHLNHQCTRIYNAQVEQVTIEQILEDHGSACKKCLGDNWGIRNEN